jgi:glycosyl transferase family 2
MSGRRRTGNRETHFSRRLHVFVVSVTALFLLINLGASFALWIPSGFLGVGYTLLLEFAFIGLAVDVVERTLGLALRVSVPARNRGLSDAPPVAPLVLSHLSNQDYPALDVFVLDDSAECASRAIVDSCGLRVIRRNDRCGFKAGNLNNWLRSFGDRYKYFVIADADSMLPPSVVRRLVSCAEHPRNASTAIFDTVLYAWNRESRFVELQTVMIPVHTREKLRTDAWLGWTISVGHNNLVRTDAIRRIGGFPECYSSEDQAVTMALARAGWSCQTVPVKSYERMPARIQQYARRQARYAYQTFQLATFPLPGVPWPLRLRVLRELQNYSCPAAAVAGMVLFIAGNACSWGITSGGLVRARAMHGSTASAVMFWMGTLGIPLLLRLPLARRSRIRLPEFAWSAVFGSAVFTMTLWPILRRVLQYAILGRADFDVTGRRDAAASTSSFIRLGAPGCVLTWLSLVSVITHLGEGFLNLVWLVPGCLAPLLIHYWQSLLYDTRE